MPAARPRSIPAPAKNTPPAAAAGNGLRFLAVGILVVAVLLVYYGSFSGPFVFDDKASIVENPTIRHLWPITEVLSARGPAGSTASGRPVLNLSLALNYALSGTSVRSYHAVNLAIHLLAALTLFGLLRRTLARMGGAGSAGQGRPTPPPDTHLPAPGPSAGALAAAGDAARQSDAAALAFAIALLWALHPLQTEAVTYVVQRAESLAGLFFLLTLYGFVRAVESGKPPRARHWFLASIVTCLLGMASKEVMVSAPLIVLLYDRTFVAGSFAEACRRRGRYYAGLAATWLLLAWLVLGTAGRGGTAGLGTPVPWWAYTLTQGQAIVRYLQLTVWPHPLVFDYGTSVVRSWVEAWWQTTAVLALLGLAIWALFKKPRTGFLAAAFFVILAPTSSVVPVATQTMAEHRMYLPLVSVITLLILGLYSLLRNLRDPPSTRPSDAGTASREIRDEHRIWWPAVRGPVALLPALALALPLGWLTARRNADYRTDLALWSETVVRWPDNARAHCNLSVALERADRPAEARQQYEAALRLMPDYIDAHYNLANLLLRSGQVQAAVAHYEEALKLRPDFVEAKTNLGNALIASGRREEGIAQLEAVLRLKPGDVDAHFNLGITLLDAGRLNAAVEHLQQVVRLQPGDALARSELGRALLELGRTSEAAGQFQEALRLDPTSAQAREGLDLARRQIQR